MRTVCRLALVVMMGCTEGTTDKADGSEAGDRAGGLDSADADAGWSPCSEGLEVGQCPADVPLVDGAETPHAFSEYQGGTVLIMGVAEW